MSNLSISSPGKNPDFDPICFEETDKKADEMGLFMDDPELSDDNMPFQTEEEMMRGKKDLAKIKNKQAARKYRERKKSMQNNLL